MQRSWPIALLGLPVHYLQMKEAESANRKAFKKIANLRPEMKRGGSFTCRPALLQRDKRPPLGNNPTGRHVERDDLARILCRLPADSRCWVDEAYVDYVGSDQSLEQFAASSTNVVVCKSLSKVYALSGMRAAYLVGGSHIVDALRVLTPPWAVRSSSWDSPGSASPAGSRTR